ncbi:hypothetical protein [Lysinibacillus sp. FSL K6-3209]|uniref:hypothetical protein n=1 Tax=Lysinibacillus sp. FSL K6-3209 TaxID=2921497 RepID=UPI0030DDBD2D
MTKTHGQSGTKLYYVWVEMRQRCRNVKSKKYKHYGGRGIQVCNEWQKFENFFKWSHSNGYKEGLSLDRIDVNGNYEPTNCRWATQLVQVNNTRKTPMYYYKGKEQSLADWARELNLNYYTLRSRARIGWTPKAMFETPMEGKMFGRDKNVR